MKGCGLSMCVRVCVVIFLFGENSKLFALTLVIASECVVCVFCYGRVPKEGSGNCVLLKFHDNCHSKEPCFV